jgi:uncharacterized membrane protein YhaH (DUF805 family)
LLAHLLARLSPLSLISFLLAILVLARPSSFALLRTHSLCFTPPQPALLIACSSYILSLASRPSSLALHIVRPVHDSSSSGYLTWPITTHFLGIATWGKLSPSLFPWRFIITTAITTTTTTTTTATSGGLPLWRSSLHLSTLGHYALGAIFPYTPLNPLLDPFLLRVQTTLLDPPWDPFLRWVQSLHTAF